MTFYKRVMPTTTQPPVDAMTQLDTDLLAAGFTLEDTFTSGADITKVYKSLAATNGIATWYLLLRRQSATGSIYFGVCEDYDAATDKVKKYAPSSQGLTPIATPGASLYAFDATTGVAPNSSAIQYVPITLSTGEHLMVYSINSKRVILCTRASASDSGVYAGLYDDLLPTAISPMPLCVVRLQRNSFSTSLGSSTREPNTTTANSNNFFVYLDPTRVGGYLTTGVSDYHNYFPGAKVAIVSGRNAANGYRGYLKDVVEFTPGGVAAGDKINGYNLAGVATTYRLIGHTSFPFGVLESA